MIWPGRPNHDISPHRGFGSRNSATNPHKERARTGLQPYNKGIRFPLISLYAILFFFFLSATRLSKANEVNREEGG